MRLIKRIEVPNDTYNTILCIDKFDDNGSISYNISIKNNIYNTPQSFIDKLKYFFRVINKKEIIYAELNNVESDSLKKLVPELLELINSK